MTILITGANRGVGRGLLDHYRAAGERTIGTTRGAAGDDWITLDVTDPEAQCAMAGKLDGVPIDLLVCNAGVLFDRDDEIDHGYPADKWAQMLATNVTGVFLTVQSLLPNLRAAKGKVAIIASQLGSSTIASGGRLIYCASKAAAINLGANLAQELKGDGIAVGSYHPGWVQTDMGGETAAITVADSVAGLTDRFAALSLGNTGCFETHDGQPHPF
ncbi:MAG: SDR family NAD(P)-dependent oxidoreductase [Paracoccaceae bacterium]